MLRYVLEPGLAQRPSEQAVDSNSIHRQQKAAEDPEAILQALRATTIGAAEEVHTPFGLRRTVYADYTASGRASSIVEDFVRDQVLPRYGNTHTLATATARQTTYFRAEAREVIRHHLNATHEDAVIFAGNGSTGAAHLLVQTMQRAGFNVGASPGASASAGETVRDMYFREDRWGGGECTLCGVRVKSANIYQAHRHSEAHRAKLCAKEQSSDAHSGQGDVPALRRRRVVVLADAVLHHSSSLPFHELVPQYPLTGVAAMSGFSGGCWRMTAASSNQSPAQDVPLAHASGVEVEVSTVPVDVTTGLLDESEFRQRLEALRSWTGTASRTDVGGDGAGGVTQDCQLVVICILAAASNVTGLCADVPHLTGLARGIIPGAIVCWDFAASLGHQVCNLNPPGDAAAFVDAAFFSPHKLWGGPGSVGILAVKKRILCNAVPAVPGGGVVFYVSDAGHSYIQNSEEREEAGTPNIVGCIRAGLVFHTLDQLPVGLVASREGSMLERVLAAWGDHPRIDVLGPGLNSSNSVVSRTGVVSFMIRYGNAKPGLYLHYNYVVAVLNDLFGVQARGGCACAGPYAQWLLGISPELSIEMEHCLAQSAQEVLRPGFVRVGVHWAMSDDDVEVLIAAVRWVADNGWKLLAAYTFDRETGEWLHRMDVPERRRVWISNMHIATAAAAASAKETVAAAPIARFEAGLGIGHGAPSKALRGAEDLLLAAGASLKEAYSSAQVALSQSKWPVLHADYAHLLWFALPADVAFTLKSSQPDRPQLIPSGESVFASNHSPRPEHSVLDAQKIQIRSSEDPGIAMHETTDEAWDQLQDMIPEAEEEEEDGTLHDHKAVSFSSCQLRPSIPKPLRGMVGKAISDFKMIEDGDRLLIGLSGGKDSLAVLHILLALRKSAPINFEIAAATVDPETPEFNPWPLVPYLEALGVKYHMLSKPIIEMAKTHMDPKRPSLCAFCSRMKRGMLYSCMRDNGYNVLVLGQHLDDFAESFFMSAIHNGLLRTMKANYWVQQEDVRVCRPLLYVRESHTATFAKENKLPVIADNCPACFAAPKERHKTKVLLSSLEFDYPALFSILLRTMRPLYALTTADRGNGVLALETEGGDGGSLDALRARRTQVSSGGVHGNEGRRRASPKMHDDADEDAAAELVLSACGPSAAGDTVCGMDSTPEESLLQDWGSSSKVVRQTKTNRVHEHLPPLDRGVGFMPGFMMGLAFSAAAVTTWHVVSARRSTS